MQIINERLILAVVPAISKSLYRSEIKNRGWRLDVRRSFFLLSAPQGHDRNVIKLIFAEDMVVDADFYTPD